jgi:type IV pilus assembly protein PilX
MKSPPKSPFERARIMRQRGVVLIFALIALLAIMLAAVALIRSVDTSTMIAGNLAFKQAATTSGDAGTEAAMSWLATTQAANNAKNIYKDATHAFNVTNAAAGYYSNADPALSLFANATWNAITAIPAVTDSSGNSISYIIQRACRNGGVKMEDADCLFSGAIQDTNGQNIPLPQDICTGSGCPVAGQAPMIRITSRVKGPKNTVSYLQAFVY